MLKPDHGDKVKCPFCKHYALFFSKGEDGEEYIKCQDGCGNICYWRGIPEVLKLNILSALGKADTNDPAYKALKENHEKYKRKMGI